MVYNKIKRVLPEFRLEGKYVAAEEPLSGNINNTYHLIYREASGKENHYTLQQINSYAFKNPYAVMENIDMVTSHVRKKFLANGIDPTRHTLEIISTVRGDALYESAENGYWRVYRFIQNAIAYDRVEKPEHFLEAGRAFGEFQKMLCDFPAERLSETIPDFHNTTRRFYAFVASLAEDKVRRVAALEPEIEFFFERRRMMNEIVKRLATGGLPLRVTHNDTKINNVMIDTKTGKAVCVIDLDTVMPGSSLYDYGDAIRFGASTAAEDEPDPGKISLDLDLFTLFTRGFLSEVNGFLRPEELHLLPLGLKVITCELAMRFLTDYIDGDLYFKVKSPEHNLVRARAQMALLRDIEQKYDQLQSIVDDLIK